MPKTGLSFQLQIIMTSAMGNESIIVIPDTAIFKSTMIFC